MVVGGRVGGLLNPPGARVLAVGPWAVVVLGVTDEATPGRRVVVVVVPGRLGAAVLAGPFALEGVAGEESVAGLAGSATGAASSC